MPTHILEISELVRARKISPVELTQECLRQIAKLNPLLNAFITVTAESALAEAEAAEEEISKGGWRGPLHGIPVALKDLIDTEGVATTAASALFKDRIPAEDAEVVRRLKRAGAVLLGKQNLHEFAYGGSSMISYFGEVRNPWNPAHVAGGSSGGSASAVAAGLCYAALGTDTAGSVREPAALCGVVGLKATYGRVSARGVIPLSRSLDHIGPIARSVADAAIVMRAIMDRQDGEPGPTFDTKQEFAPIGIGVPRRFFYDDLDPEIAAATECALATLEQLGGQIVEFDLPIPTDRTLQNAESFAVHAENIVRSPQLYQPETLRRIRNGEHISREEIANAERELQALRRSIGSIFDQVDVLVTPTTPIAAPEIAELKQHPDRLRPREILLLRNTRPVNVWGLPAISVPCGFTTGDLPIGLQIIGAWGDEARVLKVAHAYEQATTWHERVPKLF
jgi:aspartyl-tRNA(Asn)/glutamyl-tRNA(Gln) amidotransferase subunit A